MLLNKGSDINLKNEQVFIYLFFLIYSQTPLNIAIINKNIDVVMNLISKGANINFIDSFLI